MWMPRSTYINQGELLAGPVAAYLLHSRLANRLAFWFIDNQAACTALIKAASPVEDNSRMALIAGLSLAAIRSFVWYEYVHTKQNPSDGLSRDGWADSIVRAKLMSGEWEALPSFDLPWDKFCNMSLAQTWELFTALGVNSD